jgi:putative acetyltransferase
MPMITLEIASPDRPDARQLIQELDDYLSGLYPADSNHILDIPALMQPSVRFLLAFADGQSVGCGAVRFMHDYAEIKRMYVRPGGRGLGIGWRLLARLEDIASGQGIATMRLETGIHQPAAIRLYERHGYTKCGPFGDYAADPLSLFYEKQLEVG